MPRLSYGLEQVFTNLGIVGAGYKLYFFETGTTTPKTTYTDENLNVANTNPVILDAAGRAETGIWGADLSSYRMALGDPDSTISTVLTNPIVDVDPIDVTSTNNIAGLTPIPTAYWGTTGGTSTAYTLNPALVDITSYSNQQTFFIDFHIACGASPTININGLGALNLKKYTGQGTKVALLAGDIQAQRHLCINDGVDIVVLDPISQNIYTGTSPTITISSGVAVVTNVATSYKIDTESGAASDDLDTINGTQEGEIIIIQSANDARDVVVKHNTGNIYLNNTKDYNLVTTKDKLVLQNISGTLVEIARNKQIRFGDYLDIIAGTNYQAAYDGIAFAQFEASAGTSTLALYSDATTTPTQIISVSPPSSVGASVCGPIKKGNYYRVERTGSAATVFSKFTPFLND